MEEVFFRIRKLEQVAVQVVQVSQTLEQMDFAQIQEILQSLGVVVVAHHQTVTSAQALETDNPLEEMEEMDFH